MALDIRASGMGEAAFHAGRVVGSVPPPSLRSGLLGVVIDDELRQAVAANPDGTFSFPLNGLRIPLTVQLQELATGRRLLPDALAIGHVADGFALDDLAFDGTMLDGGFSLAWAPHPFLPVSFVVAVGHGAEGHGAEQHGAEQHGAAGPELVAGGVADLQFADATHARYRFRLPVATPPGHPIRVLPVVGGLARHGAVREISRQFDGYVDTVDGSEVEGWAVDATAPDRPVRIEVRRDGRVVTSVLTDRPRPDVARSIPGAELCGFLVRIPLGERMRAGDAPYLFVVGGTETMLRNGAVQVTGAPVRLNQLDAAVGGVLEGWAVDRTIAGPVRVEARHGGRVLARGYADGFRTDLAAQHLGAPGLPPGHCAFALRLEGADAGLEGVEVVAVGDAAGGDPVADQPVSGSPIDVPPNPNLSRFVRRRERVRPALLPRLRAALDRRVGRRSVSLVMCVDGAAPDALDAALAAVVGQWCSRWELLCVHDGFAEPAAARVIARHARREPRVRMVPLALSEGPAALLQAGIAAARSGYVALLPPGHRLEPDAVYHLLRALRDTGADVLFTDGYVPGPLPTPEVRTAFSPAAFRAAPFRPDLLCIRTVLAQSLPAMAADGLAAHALAAAGTVAHVPALAVARPAQPLPRPAAPPAFAGRVLAVLAGPDVPAWVAPSLAGTMAEIVVIDGADGPAARNRAVAGAAGPFDALLFAASGMADVQPGVVPGLLALVGQPGVAAAGPALVDGAGRVVAAGLVLTATGVAAGRAGGGLPADAHVRAVSALPDALLAIDGAVWAASGGYDPAFGAGREADADLCLRLAAGGAAILLDEGVAVPARARPAAPADGALFAVRHAEVLRGGDPCYSPFLAADAGWAIRQDPGCGRAHPARVTRMPIPIPPTIPGARPPETTPPGEPDPPSPARRRRPARNPAG